MPVYTFICKDCGEKFDLLIGVTSEDAELKCGKCGSKKVEKVFSNFSVGSSHGKSDPYGGTCPTGTCNL
ncbi:MAG: zinc ribbon domain-containing protein [Candidatus Omnitrophota bacterium]